MVGTFLEGWKGISLFMSVMEQVPTVTVTSDASGVWGCGTYSSAGHWFQFQWPDVWASVHITGKELLPIVVACAVWGHQWNDRTIRCLCDNAAVVAILRSGSSKHGLVMHLLCCLFFFTTYRQLYL